MAKPHPVALHLQFAVLFPELRQLLPLRGGQARAALAAFRPRPVDLLPECRFGQVELASDLAARLAPLKNQARRAGLEPVGERPAHAPAFRIGSHRGHRIRLSESVHAIDYEVASTAKCDPRRSLHCAG